MPRNKKDSRGLYPAIEPYAHGWLDVSERHRVYFEECGNPDGRPVLFVHGGPGAGAEARSRRFFDPQRYRIVLFDQRGCGRSRPLACVEDNHTRALIADMEQLRRHLDVDRWMLFGGSWGSTLSLLYMQAHPERVTAAVLRGVFLLRRAELHWFYQYGAPEMFPEAYQDFVAPIPEAERDDLLTAYHRRLHGDDPSLALKVAREWARWEASTSLLRPSQALIDRMTNDDAALAMARLETHYFVNGGFMDDDDQILRDAARLQGIPGVIVQGRYDVVCPVKNAWQLSSVWPDAELQIVADAGHSAFEAGTCDLLVRTTDRFAASH